MNGKLSILVAALAAVISIFVVQGAGYSARKEDSDAHKGFEDSVKNEEMAISVMRKAHQDSEDSFKNEEAAVSEMREEDLPDLELLDAWDFAHQSRAHLLGSRSSRLQDLAPPRPTPAHFLLPQTDEGRTQDPPLPKGAFLPHRSRRARERARERAHRSPPPTNRVQDLALFAGRNIPHRSRPADKLRRARSPSLEERI